MGCLPLLVVHFQQLWARPHYQFFPLILVSVGILYQMRRFDNEPVQMSDNRLVAGTALICGFLLAIFAVLRISPLMCWGAWLVIALSTVSRSRVNLWAAWGLLCLLLRLPQGKDLWLIQSLQRLTTSMASTVLDQMQIDHLQEGNVLAFPVHKLFVEEACSGVVTLFMIVATAAIMGALLRRTFLHTVMLMLAAAFWAAAANILRIVVIAYGLEVLGIDLVTGWKHDALGLTVFAISVVALISTDAFYRFAFGPIEIDETGSPEPIHENWIVMLWNRAFWPRHERPISGVTRTEPLPEQPSRAWGAFVVMMSIGFFGLAAVQVWGGIGPFSRGLAINQTIEQVEQESLPAELAGWKRIDFHQEKRSASSEFGERSQQWVYEKDRLQAIVSLDYPFPEWHHLDSCYRGVGWRTSHRLPVPDSPSAVQHALANDLQTGWLIFDMFDQSGGAYIPPLGTGFHPRWRRLLSGDSTPWSFPTYYQIQVFSSRNSSKLYERSRQADLRELFLAARSHIRSLAFAPSQPKQEVP